VKIAYLSHSFRSCWNHGNAHFQRGLVRALQSLGHRVLALEPANGWSFRNLVAQQGPAAIRQFRSAYPDISPVTYDPDAFDADALLDGVDMVLVHEWTDPGIVAAIGTLAKRRAGLTAYFHDTHHRMISDPRAMSQLDLSGYSGVLAFGEALAAIYRRQDWGDRVFVWHEAADTAQFRPPPRLAERDGLCWIGNWGDGERAAALDNWLLKPARSAGMRLDVWGVRYPASVLASLRAQGGHFHGWAPNAAVSGVFGRHRATVHVPRRFYVEKLPGIPTIRVFEALAAGIPLACAPWNDCEGLFTPGEDYLVGRSPEDMALFLNTLNQDAALARALRNHGLKTIRARHTCLHRAKELLDIHTRIGGRIPVAEAAS